MCVLYFRCCGLAHHCTYVQLLRVFSLRVLYASCKKSVSASTCFGSIKDSSSVRRRRNVLSGHLGEERGLF